MESARPKTKYLSSALSTLEIEIDGVLALKAALQGEELSAAFNEAIIALARPTGRVVLTGMGKSGHIARKVASTMRSTGAAAMFLHPGEASHGDLGVIGQDDTVFALSWSGETRELQDIVRYCNQQKITLIVATSRPDSMAGRAADICLTLPLVKEACPNELAPTTSTTLQLVLGDAVAMALVEARGLTSSDFHRFHPGGRLGALSSTLGEVMGNGDAIPRVHGSESLINATVEMSRKRYGCTAIVDDKNRLIGAFTDGDLRRCISVYDLNDSIDQHMSPNPLVASPDMLAGDALRMLNENAVSVLFVVADDELCGIVHIHDLVRLGAL
jgi:arabinose-5-phosphate isomerase